VFGLSLFPLPSSLRSLPPPLPSPLALLPSIIIIQYKKKTRPFTSAVYFFTANWNPYLYFICRNKEGEEVRRMSACEVGLERMSKRLCTSRERALASAHSPYAAGSSFGFWGFLFLPPRRVSYVFLRGEYHMWSQLIPGGRLALLRGIFTRRWCGQPRGRHPLSARSGRCFDKRRRKRERRGKNATKKTKQREKTPRPPWMKYSTQNEPKERTTTTNTTQPLVPRG
jgi:hypothetical protein